MSEAADIAETQIQSTGLTKSIATPWARYWSKMLDLWLAGSIVLAIWFGFVLLVAVTPGLERIRTAIATASNTSNFVWNFVFLFCAMVVDAMVLAAFGSTLGLKIIGAQLEKLDHTRLSFRDCFHRNASLLIYGFWFGVPVLAIIPLFLNHQNANRGEVMKWDQAAQTRVYDYRGNVWRTTLAAFFSCCLWAGYAALASNSLGGAGPAAVSQPTIEQKLDRSHPIMVALHRYFPSDYENVIKMILEQSPNGDVSELTKEDTDAINNKIFPFVSNVISKHKSQIDDAGVNAIFSVTIEEARLLRDGHPSSCLALFNGQPSQGDLASVMPPALSERDQAATAAVLEQIATRPAAPAIPMPKAQIAVLGRTAFNRLSMPEQDLVRRTLRSGNRPQGEPAMGAMCDFDIEIYEQALAGPPGTLRSLDAAF